MRMLKPDKFEQWQRPNQIVEMERRRETYMRATKTKRWGNFGGSFALHGNQLKF